MTNNFRDYFGHYHYMELAFEVMQIEDQLVAAVSGVPEGFEILLKPVEGDSFKMLGGPIDGTTIRFKRDSEGSVMAIKTGHFEIGKVTPEALKELPLVERLLAPEVDLTPKKRAHFSALWASTKENTDGGWIDYDLSYPVHEFVQYITDLDEVIFHGSNNPEIETFEPVRKSVELRDKTGRGNVQGVYGTHDGLWAMFFAVMDRNRLEGSIRNGVMYFRNRAGEQLASYQFSINQEQLEERPYTAGALYLLPRDTFVRLKMTPESYANEWASTEPVRPYGKLRLQPEDFPFLEQISGHDDGELIRLGAISKEIRQSATLASLEGDRFVIRLPAETSVVADLEEYLSLQKEMMPAAKFELQRDDPEVKIVITSLPPAMKQVLSDAYKDLLAA